MAANGGLARGCRYVAGKDMASRELLVAQGHDHPALLARAALLGRPTWLAGSPPAQLQPRGGAGGGVQWVGRAPEGWELQLQWARALRCWAKVSYRQQRLVGCWVVAGEWRQAGAAGGSGGDGGGMQGGSSSAPGPVPAPPAPRQPLPQAVRPSSLFLLGAAPDATGCHDEQLVAVFDSPLRGLAPQQAVVLFAEDGGAAGTGGTSEGGPDGEQPRRAVLGSAPVLVPGQTVFEEQSGDPSL